MRTRLFAAIGCVAAITLSTGAVAAPHQASIASRTPRTFIAPTQSGQTVRMHVGDKLKITLGASFRRPTSTNRAVIHRINHSGGYPTNETARATFKAMSAGKAVISSETDAPCLHATPRCEIAQQAWFVHVIVK
ncbi:MAG TPA: hypothetical protein VHC43_11115 [Mycobacteriales bacterium]|nr:hypothetical protein [Mycobacteriales bacterium]